jgi:hypothetical protein
MNICTAVHSLDIGEFKKFNGHAGAPMGEIYNLPMGKNYELSIGDPITWPLWLGETSKTLSYVAVDPVPAIHYTYVLRYV